MCVCERSTKWKVVERVNREGFERNDFYPRWRESSFRWCWRNWRLVAVVRCRWGGNILKGCESVAGRVAPYTCGEEQNQLAQTERVTGGRARCYLACSLDEISASSFRPLSDPPSSSQPPPRTGTTNPRTRRCTHLSFDSLSNQSRQCISTVVVVFPCFSARDSPHSACRNTAYRYTVYRHTIYRYTVYRHTVYRHTVYRHTVYRYTVYRYEQYVDIYVPFAWSPCVNVANLTPNSSITLPYRFHTQTTNQKIHRCCSPADGKLH